MRVGQTAIKALRVLERLVESERPLGVSEIARSGGVAKSNVHRLLAALVATGHARRREDGAYEPTLRMWELGVRVLNRLDLRGVARPHLQALEARTDETVHLTIRAGAEIVYIDKIESHHPVREFTRIGDRAPAHCTATGKVLLAFAATEVPLPRRLPAFTPATIRDPRRLASELERVRRQGYAFNVGEYGAHVNGVAAPIADHEGKVVAAVAISGPSERIRPASLRACAPLVLEAAQTISERLGCRSRLPGWHEPGPTASR